MSINISLYNHHSININDKKKKIPSTFYKEYTYLNQNWHRLESRMTYLYLAQTHSLRLVPTRFDFLWIISLGDFPNELDFADQSLRPLSCDPPMPTQNPSICIWMVLI